MKRWSLDVRNGDHTSRLAGYGKRAGNRSSDARSEGQSGDSLGRKVWCYRGGNKRLSLGLMVRLDVPLGGRTVGLQCSQHHSRSAEKTEDGWEAAYLNCSRSFWNSG